MPTAIVLGGLLFCGGGWYVFSASLRGDYGPLKFAVVVGILIVVGVALWSKADFCWPD